MTEDEAIVGVGHLVGGLHGFTDDSVDGYVVAFQKLDDADALDEVCRELARTWTNRWRPPITEVIGRYHAHPRVAAAREESAARAMLRTVGAATHCDGSRWVDEPGNQRLRPCPRCNPLAAIYGDEDKWERWRNGVSGKELLGETAPMPVCKIDTWHDPERIVGMGEGMVIANDHFRSAYGRGMKEPPTPNPVFAVDTIQRLGHFDPKHEVWRISYATLLAEFRGDQARTRASLTALGRRITHDDRGTVVLRLPEEELPSHPPAVEAPADRPPDPSGLLTEALGITRSRMENRDG